MGKLRLSELAFNNMFISEGGDVDVVIPREGDDLQELPADFHDDAHTFLEQIRRETRFKEFRLLFDGVYYRVSRIDASLERSYAVRRAPAVVPGPESLGFVPRLVDLFTEFGREKGLVLVIGGVSKGKTTTASSIFKHWFQHYGGVACTVEDPPELPLEGLYRAEGTSKRARCYQIPTDIEHYDKALYEALRYMPKFMLVGEVRTPSVASQVLRWGMTGHCGICTAHADDIDGAVLSLLKMSRQVDGDMARDLLAHSLIAIIYQDLKIGASGRADGAVRRFVSTKVLVTARGSECPVRHAIRAGDKLESLVQRQQARLTQLTESYAAVQGGGNGRGRLVGKPVESVRQFLTDYQMAR